MSDRFYHTLRKVGAPFRYNLDGKIHLNDHGAALFVSNHLGAIGPIECILSIPRRLFPWIVADMVDPAKIADYLYRDFVSVALHVSGKMGKFISEGLSKITLPLLHRIDCIPVDRHDVRFLGAFRHSLDVLKKGGALLILPEDPETPLNSQSGMRSFMSGFLWLCPMYKRLTGEDLPVIPVAVRPSHRRVIVDQPLYYIDSGQPKQDMLRLSNALEKTIVRLYIE